jgi:hypothetical protein
MRNNVFEDTGRIQLGRGVTLDSDHNGWFNAAQTLDGVHDVVGTTATFVDKANSDYHLRADSPCVNAGTDVGFPYSDTAPDLGAYEYESHSTTNKIAQCIEELRAIASQLETCASKIDACVSKLETCL